MLEFSQARFSTGLAHSTLKVYVAAIATYHAPLGGLSVGKTTERFLQWRPGSLCLVVDLDAILWSRVLWSPLAFGSQGSLNLRYGGLQGLLAGVPVQDICDAGGWSTPLTFPGSTTWLCEPLLAHLFPCHSCAFHTLSRDLQVWRRGHLVPHSVYDAARVPGGERPRLRM